MMVAYFLQFHGTVRLLSGQPILLLTQLVLEPKALDEEIDFILRTAEEISY